MKQPIAPSQSRAVGGQVSTGWWGDTARRAIDVCRLASAVVAPIVALLVVVHTVSFVVQHHPLLPIADGWAPWTSLRQVLEGRMTPAEALVDRHNEHRILLTRLLFLLDLLDGGRDRISTATSLAFQVLQAGIWLVLLRHIHVGRPTRWLVGGTVVAMLFTMRHGENFISGFQAQFTGVFALDVAIALLLLPGTTGAAHTGMPSRPRLSIGTAGLLLIPFTMANGLLAGGACAITGLLTRSRAGRLIALLAVGTSTLSVMLDRALPSEIARAMPLAFTPTAALHAATYVGGTVTSGRISDVRVVGIDDFAWLKGQRYGTIICDLERRCTIDLLPDREGGTVAAWLAAHPGVEIVCRDRGSGFREGATKGAPQALQICDRWHLLENATAAFVEAVKRHMGDLRRAITGGDIDPEVLSSAENVQWAGWKRRDEVNGTVRSLKSQGHSIKGIVRATGVSRQTVRRILAGTREDVFRSRSTTLDRWGDKLCTEWDGGCRNGAELWRRLRDAGFGGSQRVVTEWATRRRRAAEASTDRPAPVTPVPPARTIARLLTSERDCRSAEALRVRVAVETTSPKIVAARNLHDRFKTMVAAKKTDDLTSWLRDAQGSELASFASGIMDDEDAVRAAIVELWSNGQTEGQVTKLKLVRRQMYGRGKIDLLQARMVQPG